MPKRRPVVERSTLTAVIEETKRTYFISEERNLYRVDDEAITNVIGKIVEISPALKRHLGHRIDMSLVCARSFNEGNTRQPTGTPSLISINLRGDQRSLMAYLPSDVFWPLSLMMTNGEMTHIEACFGPTMYGHGELLSIHWRGPEPVPVSAMA